MNNLDFLNNPNRINRRKCSNFVKLAEEIDSKEKIKILKKEDKDIQGARRLIETSNLVNSKKVLNNKTKAFKEDYKTRITKMLFKEAVFSIFMKGLVLDESFKEKYVGNLNEAFTSVYDEVINKYTNLKEEVSAKSNFLRDIYCICEEIAKNESEKIVDGQTVSDKDTTLSEKIKKNKEASDKNSITAEGKSDFDNLINTKAEMVGEMIKDKVIDVISKERENSEKEDEFISDLEELETDTNNPVVTTENGQITLNLLTNKKRIMKNESVFSAIQTNITNKIINESKLLNENIDLDLDAILAESITYYTLLETFHTIKLNEMSITDKQDLIKKLITKF